MARRRTTKTNKPTSIYPKAIQNMLRKAHDNGLDSRAITRKINDSKIAMRLGVYYQYRQIATTLGNLTRGNCYWA